MLLAPWEEWVDSPEFYWLGFRVPWAYETDDNLFDRPAPPPSPDALSWEPDVIFDHDGGVVYEGEKPTNSYFFAEVNQSVQWLNDERWALLEQVKSSPLFETPVVHFLVRAFYSEGSMDEFIAHMLTVEAALGLRSDGFGAKKRMMKRISALLGATEEGEAYKDLFDLRSQYLHGRAMPDIPSKDRLVARSLARRVVNGIVDAAIKLSPSETRESYLKSLGC